MVNLQATVFKSCKMLTVFPENKFGNYSIQLAVEPIIAKVVLIKYLFQFLHR